MSKKKEDAPVEKEEILKLENLPIEKVHPNGWNPNVQDDETFNELTKDIQSDGFDEPIIVVPDEAEPGTYKIISGEHRWKAMRAMGKDTIPAVVKEGWDEVAQKLKTVRRNLLRGRLDAQKFTRLINDIKRVYDVDHSKLSAEMGFRDEKEYWKHYQETRTAKDEAAQDILSDTRRELHAIDNLSVVLNEVFSQYGDTVNQNFLFFMYKKKMHLMVSMDGRLLKTVEELTAHLKSTQEDVNPILVDALKDKMKAMGVVMGAPADEEKEAAKK